MNLPVRVPQATDAARVEPHPPCPTPADRSLRRAPVVVTLRSGPGTNETAADRRILRMLRECQVSAAPALLLALACVAVAGFAAWSAFLR